MATVADLLTSIIGFWLLGCIVISIFGRRVNHIYPSTLLGLGGAGLLFASVSGWLHDSTFVVTGLSSFPIFLGVAPLSCHIDALSSVFIALLGVITIAVAFFSPGYMPHLDAQSNKGAYWVQLILFVIGMLGVLVAANVPTFLVSWELMAISSALLVATNLSSQESRKAAFIYLGATRIATAFLMSGFLWMYFLTASWNFNDWQMNTPVTIIPALLMLVAFCIKGGIWPFHEWLPYAHPSAPSPVSALMSGVMIKVALYAMIRIFIMGSLNSDGLIYLMLTLGIVTAFWGILCALVERDLKCLLAYSSIENVGIILIGISLCLLSQSLNLPVIAAISLTAAIFHSFNHGIFKSLLFLSAGTVDCRIHTRDLELMGGLGKKMPGTMLCFILASAAICALPPLNGFSSKWLIYQSLFRMAYGSGSLWIGGLVVGCMAILGLVGGMSVYCFTKATGIAFLGRSRSHAAAKASEGSNFMLASQVFLVLWCIGLGLMAPAAITAIHPVCASILQSPIRVNDIYTIPMAPLAVLLSLLPAVVYVFWLTLKDRAVRTYITWDCGFGAMTKRMQGTAASFTENIGQTFTQLLQYDAKTTIEGRDRRHFPENIEEKIYTTPILEAYIYRPCVQGFEWLGERMMLLQTGSIHLYLGYILVTLVVLLVIGILI
jgi:hydrogenase-4 component B